MTATTNEQLEGLLERVKAARGYSNQLDIEIELALFRPDYLYKAARANAAHTKIVYTRHDGDTDTFWAPDWTISQANRNEAVRLLAALKDASS